VKTAQADIYSQHGAEDERPIFSCKTKHPPTCLVKPYSFDSMLSQVTSVMVCDCVRVCSACVWSIAQPQVAGRRGYTGFLYFIAGCAPPRRAAATGTAHTLTGLRRAGDLRCVFSISYSFFVFFVFALRLHGSAVAPRVRYVRCVT
jgi:hypothetical protein